VDKSPEQLLDLWKKGKSLDEAIWQFCDKKYQRAYPQNHPIINITSSGSDAVNQLKKISQYQLQKSDALEKLKKNLCEKLKGEYLIAVGYPKLSHSPVIIPLYLCVPKNLDLSKSSISGNGLDYSSVCIIENPHIIPEIKLPETSGNKKGRRTQIPKIIEAYDLLQKNDKINFSISFAAHIPAIRETVRRLYPELPEKGLGDEVIRRTLKPRFDKEKECLKNTLKI